VCTVNDVSAVADVSVAAVQTESIWHVFSVHRNIDHKEEAPKRYLETTHKKRRDSVALSPPTQHSSNLNLQVVNVYQSMQYCCSVAGS